MKKNIFLLFLLTFTLFLFACSKDPGKPSPDNGGEAPDNSYTVTFLMYTERITQQYAEGELVVPPVFPNYETSEFFVVFDGWSCEFVPVTEDVTYKADYHLEYKDYVATFVMGEETVEVRTAYNTVPTPPETIPDHLGMQFFAWDKELTASTKDITYTAIYYDSSLIEKEAFADALTADLMHYANVDGGDVGVELLERAVALYVLAVQEYAHPQGGRVAERIVEHLTSIVTKDRAPNLDADTNWEYTPMMAGIAIARVTPTVWDTVPFDVQMRLQTLMRAVAYLGSLLTSDHNAYYTGPGMNGNYYKDWNPNYRLGNVPLMLYVTYFFGEGDMTEGANIVNGYLKAFDETVYTETVNTFQKYGWRRAFKNWTTEGNSGGASAKQMLIEGGRVISKDGVSSTGNGVSGAGLDYAYKTFPLYEADKIIQHLINYNYGAQAMKIGTYEGQSYLNVVNTHWYDVNGDGADDLVGYIADDSSSPFLGDFGIMTEFASGNRSSLLYCTHDFVMSTVLLHSARTMKQYTKNIDGERIEVKDRKGNACVLFDCTKNEAFFLRVQVGNEDMIYKGLCGYMSYATGIYGESHKLVYESTEKNYTIMKSVWRTALLPLGTVRPAESYIK